MTPIISDTAIPHPVNPDEQRLDPAPLLPTHNTTVQGKGRVFNIYTETMLYVATLHFLRLFKKYKSLLQTFNSMKKNKALLRLCKLSHYKMTGWSCKDKVREKVPSFQKVRLFSMI